MATKKMINVPAFNTKIDAIFAPIAASIKPNAHGAFVMQILTAYPNAVKMESLIDWQLGYNPEKYPATDSTAKKRARGNVAAHIANSNTKSKTVNFGLCGMQLKKTINGLALIPIE